MKKLLILFIVSLASFSFAEGELFIYNWSDYTSPELIEKFEAETGIKVTLDIYDSNETLLAKMKSGATGYDIIVPTNSFVPIFIAEGLLEPINATELPGYENIDPRWQNPQWDPNNVYTIPWQWGTTSFAINTKVYTEPVDSLQVLFEPPDVLQGDVGMFNHPEDPIQLALTYYGYPLCSESTDEMRQVQDLLLAQKPFVKVYNSETLSDQLVAGEINIASMWNGATMRARLQNPDIQYIYPKEGVLGWMDNLALAKGAPNKENALKFMEFMLQPENAAIQSNFARYSNGIIGSEEFMDDELSTAPEVVPPADAKIIFSSACPEAAIQLSDRVWTKLKQ
jgi:spermidine/putrescine transport system substrate-binding protein